jgi:hypothetical protein
MKFEDLVKANKEIKTTNIKGKDYAEVNQRIKVFRMLFPNGSISTSIESLENGVVVMKAVVKDEEDHVLGTGYAYEKESSSFINKTSYIENCETSAVGRALGMLGIGIDTSVASYEEVSNAIAQQEAQKAEAENKKIENSVIGEVKVKALIARCDGESVDIGKILKLYKVSSLADLTERQYAHINEHWEKIKEA